MLSTYDEFLHFILIFTRKRSIMRVMSGTKIIVGLNGALQKRFVLPESDTLIPGDVHRARSVQTGVGGKGQDAAIAMNCLSRDSGLKLAQFVGMGLPNLSCIG